MAKVMSVDEAMLQRTREWLLARRDQKGGFLRNPKSLDSFGRAPDEIVRRPCVCTVPALCGCRARRSQVGVVWCLDAVRTASRPTRTLCGR